MGNESFNFRYSAPTEHERREIENIRRQYTNEEPSESPEERLFRLHKRVTGTATAFGLCFGIIGTLIFGTGLASILEWSFWLLGIPTCIIGAAAAALAYPVYRHVLSKNRAKYSAEIIRLSDEILGQ